MWPFISILQTVKPKPSKGSQLPTNVQSNSRQWNSKRKSKHSDRRPQQGQKPCLHAIVSVACVPGATFSSEILGCFTLKTSPCFISYLQPKRWNSSSQSKTGWFFLRFLLWGSAQAPFICGSHSWAEMTETKIETKSIIFPVTATSITMSKNNNNTCTSDLLCARDKDSEISYFLPTWKMWKQMLREVKSPAPSHCCDCEASKSGESNLKNQHCVHSLGSGD